MTDFVFDDGLALVNVHDPAGCAGKVCSIHNPSDHEYSSNPRYWGYGHLWRTLDDGSIVMDPDDAAFHNIKLLRQSAVCRVCGDSIQSITVHDFVECNCGEIFVDGGYHYSRAGAKSFLNFIDTSIIAK